MLEANRLILGSLQRRIDGSVDAESTLIGPVVVETGASIAASTVRGPAVIGPGTSVRDAYIGPFTAIGPDCDLSGCEIEHSIVLERSVIRNVERRSPTRSSAAKSSSNDLRSVHRRSACYWVTIPVSTSSEVSESRVLPRAEVEESRVSHWPNGGLS